MLRLQSMMLIAVVMAAGCCGCGAVPEGKTVYVQEDAKLLESSVELNAEATIHTDLLKQLVQGQTELIEKLSSTDRRGRSIGSDVVQTSLPDADLLGDAEADQKPAEANLASVKASDDGWPEGIRLQIWKDGTPDSERWLAEELPLLPVMPEYFEAFGSLAVKHNVSQFAVMLVGEDGNIAQRMDGSVPASQVLKMAKQVKSGKLVASSGNGRTCRCIMPDGSICECPCDANGNCDCSGAVANYQITSTGFPQSPRTYLTPQNAGTMQTRVWQSPVQSVRSMTSTNRVRCVNGKCYSY